MQLRKIWKDWQSSLWFRPAVWVLSLGVLVVVLTTIDRRMSDVIASEALPWFLSGGPEGARTMLGSISAAMLTVTTLTFSIMMVAVVQTANAYSPRILRQYLSDTSNQHVLGILIGTFLFSLLALRGVRSTEDVRFVPFLTINMALILSLLSIGAFIYFINHVAQSIKVDNIIDLVYSATKDLLATPFPESLGHPCSEETSPEFPRTASAVILSDETGYVQLFDDESLIDTLTQAGAVARLECSPGDFVLRETPVATVWPAGLLNEELQDTVRAAIVIDTERALTADVLFGVSQLSDIALRALSPGINDPGTALRCINALASLLIEMVQRDPISSYRCDSEGRLRILAARPVTFRQMLDTAFNQIRRYGASDVEVLVRLLEVCADVGYVADREEERETLWEFVQLVMETADRHIEIAGDRHRINESFSRVARTLQRNPEPVLLDVPALEPTL